MDLRTQTSDLARGSRGARRGTTRRRGTSARKTTRASPRKASRPTAKKGRRSPKRRTSGASTQRPTRTAGSRASRADRYKGFTGSPTRVQVDELLLQAIETEMMSIQVYEMALRCAVNDGLHAQWERYLEEARNHERILTDLCHQRGLDAQQQSPGRQVVRNLGQALVDGMELALQRGSQEAAELVACECVVLAETKDHANWELLGELARAGRGRSDDAEAMQEAYDEVEDEVDEHLYRTMGWGRELWLKSLGLPAILPPPEEEKGVRTAVGAARAKASAMP